MPADLATSVTASLSVAQGGGQNADVARAIEQARAAQQQAAQEARTAQQEAARDAAQAQREAARALRDAQREINAVTSSGQGIPFPPLPPSAAQVPEGAVIISVAFFITCAVIAIGLPIARAIARRSDRRDTLAPGGDTETRARLERIEQAVDAIAVEVERISEGQRFTTKVLSDLRALPQPDPAAALAERDRAAVPLSRSREAR